MGTLLDAIIDRLAAGEPIVVWHLEPPAEPCRFPTWTGETAGYTAGCRCHRCTVAWRKYRRAYRHGRRLPMGRRDYARRRTEAQP